MRDDFPGGQVEWTEIAVLSGFTSDVDGATLPEAIDLRPLTHIDYCFLRAFDDRVDGVINYWWNLAREESEYCLSYQSALPATISPELSRTRHRFERVVTCLRLIQPGAVKIVALACWPTDQPTPEDWIADVNHAVGTLLLPYGLPLEGAGYHFAERVEADLLRLMSRWQDAMSVPPLRRALHFFNESYEYFRTKHMIMGFDGVDWPRENAAKHDKLIRLWMCLEALLTGSRERDDIGATVARRAEMLVDERSSQTLVRSWDVRCRAVHGEDPRDLDTVLGMTEMETRRLLARAVSEPSRLQLIRPAK